MERDRKQTKNTLLLSDVLLREPSPHKSCSYAAYSDYMNYRSMKTALNIKRNIVAHAVPVSKVNDSLQSHKKMSCNHTKT